jgi:hypothetical protein
MGQPVISPTIAFREAIGEHLASDPAVITLVDPENIRAGDFRPDELPAILFGAVTTQMGKQVETQLKGLVAAEITKQTRPGNFLNSRSR